MAGINLHHVGIWANDVDEMLNFLTEVFGFRLHCRLPRSNLNEKGERIFVNLGNQAMFEILSKPTIQPRPDIPPHSPGIGAVGIPHICLRVSDLPTIESKVRSLGYTINKKLPDDNTYAKFELGTVRALWFSGPSGVDFELFEFEEEYPFD